MEGRTSGIKFRRGVQEQFQPNYDVKELFGTQNVLRLWGIK